VCSHRHRLSVSHRRIWMHHHGRARSRRSWLRRVRVTRKRKESGLLWSVRLPRCRQSLHQRAKRIRHLLDARKLRHPRLRLALWFLQLLSRPMNHLITTTTLFSRLLNRAHQTRVLYIVHGRRTLTRQRCASELLSVHKIEDCQDMVLAKSQDTRVGMLLRWPKCTTSEVMTPLILECSRDSCSLETWRVGE